MDETEAAEPKAILFDLDGTIVDRTGMEDDWRAACDTGCAGSTTGLSPEGLLATVLEKRAWFWSDVERARIARMDLNESSERIVREALTALGHELPELAASISRDYRTRRNAALRLHRGAMQTLDAMRVRGIAMGLITNGSAQAQRATIERFGLAHYFDCIVIEGEFGCGKPDERVFRFALEKLTCEPASAWFVGDELVADIATPLRLGMHTVWVDASGDGVPAGSAVRPHRAVRSIAELL